MKKYNPQAPLQSNSNPNHSSSFHPFVSSGSSHTQQSPVSISQPNENQPFSYSVPTLNSMHPLPPLPSLPLHPLNPSAFNHISHHNCTNFNPNSNLFNINTESNSDIANFSNFNSCSHEMISSLYAILNTQTQTLQGLNSKIGEIVGKNTELVKRIEELEQENKQLRQRKGPEGILKESKENKEGEEESILEIKFEGSSVNKDNLIQLLFGKQKYDYYLKLSQQLSNPLYRQRNFSISIQLLNNSNTRTKNSNKIPLSLAIYTCQNPPKFIEKNTLGQKLLKGYVDQALIGGVCHFEKIQIRQVTSHYRGGWIFLVIIPCMSPLGTQKSEHYVDFTKIKPLVIEQVVVKAKKPKKQGQKKQQDNEQDE